MHDSVTFESYPTHPLGLRDSWPATGPIYGIPERRNRVEPARTIWQRLVANSGDGAQPAASTFGSSPIWY